MKKYGIIFIAIMTVIVVACSKQATKTTGADPKIVVAEMKSSVKKLFFKGNVRPISVVNISSSIEGTVERFAVKYGQTVKKGDLLLIVKSTALEDDYQNALTEYLKSKDSYESSKTKWQSTLELDKLGLVAKNDKAETRRSLNDRTLGLSQKRRKLLTILTKAGIENFNISKLDNIDYSEVEAQFKLDVSHLQIRAPEAGVVLVPDKASGSDTDGKKLSVGTPVKKNNVLLALGDMSGVAIDIKVNESEIEKLSLRQKVLVRVPAIPKLKLKGYVTSIDTQAEVDSSGVPMFPVRVIIPKLKQEHPLHKQLRVGMSIKVALGINQGERIRIPIKAIHVKANKTYVLVYDPEKHDSHEVFVKTGDTSIDSVSISEGLKPGDQVVLSN